jgi:tRNA splicing endonuclease
MQVEIEYRRFKGKRRTRQINTNHLHLIADLKSRGLSGLVLDAAVWLCVDEPTRHALDALCFGNLDGGAGTAAHVRALLESAGATVTGNRCVRLSLDEACFMSHAFEALDVYAEASPSSNGGVSCVRLDPPALWRRLCAARRDFQLLYLAYHHYRSKGWIPRTGLQYGADFVLYQRHPALAHSDYSVLVLPLGGVAGGRPPLTWHDLQVCNRLTTQVGKRLILLHVVNEGGRDEAVDAGDCIARCAVHERVVRRWVPESMRPAAPGS